MNPEPSLENDSSGRHSSRSSSIEKCEIIFYECNICNQRFYKNYELTYHYMMVHKRLRYKCECCNYETDGKRNLQVHFKRIHMNNYDYTCPQQGCNWAFKVQMDLKNHIKRIHSNKQKKSNSADSGLSLENNPCGEHSSKNGNNAIYRRAPKLCQICNQRFGKSHEMIYHFMNVHGRQLYSCNRCIYETNHKSNYRLHIMRMHENNYDYKCLESGCERKFKMQMDLKRHVRDIHFNKQEKSNSADSGLSLQNNSCGEHSSKSGNNEIYKKDSEQC
ncbi:zinc finger protein 2-like [Harpegnathos saltator]|uniref:zinc finger protein 2-like n=1 Tax=Harpegnathos saltator TaxID=610380 RepID=UPI00058FA771|nr:zinc finger protein 2-like [Harpegnathos saltator]